MKRFFLALVLCCFFVVPVATALDASEQSVLVLASGPQSWDSCVQEAGGYWQGDSDNEHFEGTSHCDPVLAGGGADSLDGNGDGDWLYGEAGNDTINGNGGADYVAAGCRASTCTGGTSNWLNGNTGNDIVAGRNGHGGDRINCGDGTEDHGWYDVGSTDTIVNCEFKNQ